MLPFYKKSQPAAFLVLFPLLFSIHVFAQSGNSTTVEGTVKDPSGAVVPNAKLKFTIRSADFHVTQTPIRRGRFQSRMCPSILITCR